MTLCLHRNPQTICGNLAKGGDANVDSRRSDCCYQLMLNSLWTWLRNRMQSHKKITAPASGMLPVKRTIKNNKFLYRQPCYGWRYFMLLLYIAHDISLVSLHAVSFEVVGCCSNLCN